MSRCIFLGHLVLDGRVRQDTNGLGEVMDARVWPSLQRQTVRWERHGELWQNSGRHHQESIRGLCFPLRYLFQQQRLPWPQGYFSMVQKKREIGNKWNLPTYHSTEHVRSRPRLAISYKSLFFFQPKSRVCAFVCRNEERSIVISNKLKIRVQMGNIVMKSEMRTIFCIVNWEVRNYNSFWIWVLETELSQDANKRKTFEISLHFIHMFMACVFSKWIQVICFFV